MASAEIPVAEEEPPMVIVIARSLREKPEPLTPTVAPGVAVPLARVKLGSTVKLTDLPPTSTLLGPPGASGTWNDVEIIPPLSEVSVLMT